MIKLTLTKLVYITFSSNTHNPIHCTTDLFTVLIKPLDQYHKEIQKINLHNRYKGFSDH